MPEIGIRELKNGLSRYLKRVQKGEAVVVTDHGRPVARIVPIGPPSHLDALTAEGRLTWSGQPFNPPTKAPRPGRGPLISDYIGEERR
jgi:prevent-host-death family protein